MILHGTQTIKFMDLHPKICNGTDADHQIYAHTLENLSWDRRRPSNLRPHSTHQICESLLGRLEVILDGGPAPFAVSPLFMGAFPAQVRSPMQDCFGLHPRLLGDECHVLLREETLGNSRKHGLLEECIISSREPWHFVALFFLQWLERPAPVKPDRNREWFF